ncbi:hypothetical protein DACRYDRAFT_56497 [Dacryopinax primogenitus]|uniref:PXA domain-containing protein n=1 Tax=Dacryopinax primogenitus (strain DJM 731) TaxID=1858805 RepID=M5FSX8_DACPD|nr:uncharacterized protein DACRYDRAFT_56497 [Dacryopinax primogenitus]EJT99068.1 hypothetical protein DACRYDRAFT_56497 [Dacryopinax primogenitus]
MSAQRPVSLHSSPAVYAPVPASTLPLYRRLLFPSLLQATLPPAVFLHGTPELDVATYELIAVILRSHVTPWYARLTRDRTFVPQVSAVIVHLLKEIEGRVLAADLPLLVYTTLPALVEQHYADYRAARLRHSLSSSSSISDCFTALQPHVALSPNSTSVNTEYIRQAIDHVLKTCLLEEDWEAESERTIVREVLAGPVLGGVLPRLAQPWFLFGLLLSAVGKGTGPKVPVSRVHLNVASSNRYQDQPVAKPPVTSMRQMLVLFINTLHSLTSVLHSVVSFLQAISRFLSTLPANKGASKPRYYASSLLLVVAAILNLSARLVSGLLLSYLSIIVALLQPLLDRYACTASL